MMNPTLNLARPIRWMVALIAVMVVGTGCARTESYQIVVENHSSQAVMTWLTKNGPPFDEPGWKSPEVMAIEQKAKADDPIPGTLVKPGEVIEAGPIKGKFEGDTSAVLRIYTNVTSMADLLAISANSTDRRQVILKPGKNHLIIANDGTGGIKTQVMPVKK